MATATYLDRFLDPITEAFTPELARKIINLRADPETGKQVAELRDKANEGTLNAEERTQYQEFVEAADVIAIIQAKARQFLANHSS